MAVVYSYQAQHHAGGDADHPSVSVVMTSYNQPELALKSLRSVLAQDYPNIEVVVTDDGSSDGTFEALLEECRNYVDCGPSSARFSIIICRNETNLGVTKNYEEGFLQAHGELLITQGGDDIAHPDRVSTIVKAYWASGRSAKVIFHKLVPVDMEDKDLGYEWWPLTLRNPLGAVMSYSPDVVRLFPRIDGRVGFEDGIFARRAALLATESGAGDAGSAGVCSAGQSGPGSAADQVLYIDAKLTDYRIGSGVTSTGSLRDLRIKITNGMTESARQTLRDIAFIRASVRASAENGDQASAMNGAPAPFVSEDRIAPIEALANEMIRTYTCENRMVTAPTFRLRYRAYREYVTYRKTRMRKRDFYGLTTYYIPLLLPALGPLSLGLYDFAARHHRTRPQ